MHGRAFHLPGEIFGRRVSATIDCARVTLLDSLIAEYGGDFFNIAGIEERVRVNISDVRDEHLADLTPRASRLSRRMVSGATANACEKAREILSLPMYQAATVARTLMPVSSRYGANCGRT